MNKFAVEKWERKRWNGSCAVVKGSSEEVRLERKKLMWLAYSTSRPPSPPPRPLLWASVIRSRLMGEVCLPPRAIATVPVTSGPRAAV